MVARSSKAKAKHRPTAKAKAKRARSKPLLAVEAAATVRTAHLCPKLHQASNGNSPTSSSNPALTMIELIGRVMGAYAEFPARLAQCRSPMDIWLEQARFMQRVFSESTATTDRPLRAASASR